MRDLLGAEWLKARSQSLLPFLVVGGVVLATVVVLGLVSQGAADVSAGHDTVSNVTDQAVRYWMTMHLFSSLFGAVFVTGEYSSHAISRSVLLGGGRDRLFTAKALAGTAMGVVLGLITAAAAAASPWIFLPAYGLRPEWTTTTWQVLPGVFAVTVLAAPWGVLVGWICRNQTVAVGLLAVLTMAFEPYLFDLVPAIGKFMLTIAFASLYLDGDPELLSVPAALAVVAAWFAAAWIIARRLLTTRDIT